MSLPRFLMINNSKPKLFKGSKLLKLFNDAFFFLGTILGMALWGFFIVRPPLWIIRMVSHAILGSSSFVLFGTEWTSFHCTLGRSFWYYFIILDISFMLSVTGWTMVFKIVSGVHTRVWELYSSNATSAEFVTAALDVTKQHQAHYKNRVVLNWSSFNPTQVSFENRRARVNSCVPPYFLDCSFKHQYWPASHFSSQYH